MTCLVSGRLLEDRWRRGVNARRSRICQHTDQLTQPADELWARKRIPLEHLRYMAAEPPLVFVGELLGGQDPVKSFYNQLLYRVSIRTRVLGVRASPASVSQCP